MRIKDEKQESEDIEGKNDENTGICQSRMNTESRSIAIDQTNDVLLEGLTFLNVSVKKFYDFYLFQYIH